MQRRVRTAILAVALWVAAHPVAAESLEALSHDIGSIERGFWTRPVTNDLRIDGTDLIIRRTYRTNVEWADPGVPGRVVTDTLQWRLPLMDLRRVEIMAVPGAHLLEGGDQDT